MMTTAERTPIATFQDILNAMAEKPELKAQMRQLLQDEDLRNLPQTVARLEQAVADLTVIVLGIAERQERTESDVAEIKAGQSRLEAGQARHDADIAELKAGQANLEGGQAKLEAGQAKLEAGQARLEDNQRRMQSDINRLSGSEYERRVARTLRRNARRHFGIGNGQLIHSITIPNNSQIPDLLDTACDQGIIQSHEADHAEQADIVILGRNQDDDPAYAVIEASVTVEPKDIIRAAERADIISRATDCPAIPAVCGAQIDDAAEALATQYHIVVIILPD